MSAPLERSVRKLEPKRLFVGLGFGIYALALPMITMGILVAPPVLFGLIHVLLFGTMALSYGYRSLDGATETPGKLTIDDDVVKLDGALLARRSELKQGFLVPDATGTLLRLERKGALSPGIHLRVKDEAEGRELLRALGFDAGHAAAEMRIATGLLAMNPLKQMLMLLPPVFGVVALSLLSAVVLGHAAGPVIAFAVLMSLVWTFGLAFTPTKVRVGTDGIVTRWLGRERFIPYASVDSVQTYDEWVGTKQQRGVRVTLHSGEQVKLPTGQTSIGTSEAARLAQRIAEAREAGRTGDAAATTLLRGGRTAKEWVRALRGAGEGAQNLRTAAVPHDVLLRVVEDAGATESARVSAAIAALATADDDAKTRIRVAAEVSASPKLRVALDKVATSPTDDELAEILERVDATTSHEG